MIINTKEILPAANSALKKCGVPASCKRIFSAAESVGACDELRNYLYI
jgi:hypothetical protein